MLRNMAVMRNAERIAEKGDEPGICVMVAASN